MKDFFLKTYQKKSDTELEKIAEAQSDYEADAREAALETLLERKGNSSEVMLQVEEFQLEKEEQMAKEERLEVDS